MHVGVHHDPFAPDGEMTLVEQVAAELEKGLSKRELAAHLKARRAVR